MKKSNKRKLRRSENAVKAEMNRKLKEEFSAFKAEDKKFERENAFRNHSGENVGNIVEYLQNYMTVKANTSYDIFVGCDSQVNRSRTMFSVVIGVHTIVDEIGRGVHIVHTREPDRKYGEDRGDIFARLWSEVQRIVDTVLFLQTKGIDTSQIGAHVDANVKKEFASNMIYEPALGYLNSLGFKVEGKPYAWAATYAANRYCR